MTTNIEPTFGHALLKDFLFDPKYKNLNHGSFGTYPRVVQTQLRSFQDAAEARPDRFIRWDFKVLLDESRAAVAKLLNVETDTCVFVSNATTGVNTVLRNLVYKPGDIIVYFDTVYGACERSVSYITETTAAEAVKVQYTYPVSDTWLVREFKRVVKAEQAKGNNVRVAIFDTVVSLPGLRMPFEQLTEACRELGVLSCVDGAHGVGHIELDLGKLDPDFFVSNCHKWLYTPRGCAVFYVPFRNQHLIRSTLPTSHGFIPNPKPGEKLPNNPLPPSAKPAYITNFEFVGTIDNGPYLCLPAALKYRESIGGEKAIMKYCHKLAYDAGELTAKMLGTEVMENAEGTLANCCLRTVRLPLDLAAIRQVAGKDDVGSAVGVWLTSTMVTEYNTFIALIFYNHGWWVRWSGQVYLELEDFEWGAKILLELCERVMQGEFLAGPKSVPKL